MRKLSLWAKYHPTYARAIIIVSHVILIWLGYLLGMQLTQMDIQLSYLWIYLPVALSFAMVVLYPYKRSSENYLRRKFCDFFITCCSFFLTVCVVNDLNRPFTISQSAYAVTPVDPSSYKYSEAKKLLEQFEKGEKTKFTSKEKRIIKKEFKYQLGRYIKAKVAGNKSDSGDAGAIILICVAAVGLFFLLSALACNIACNGSEVAAWIVFLLGTAAIIIGAVAAIRAIKRKHATVKTKSS